LQTFACNQAIHSDFPLARLAKSNNKKVAVIGSGPSGIACACELRTLGYYVDVFEAKANPSGLALHGTAPYKILNAEVMEELDYLQRQFGFTLKLNHYINDPTKIESEYDAIFLGIGLGSTGSLQIPGENIQGSYKASSFIEKVKLTPLKAYPGETVIVIGGGNTAMDAASESLRLGAMTVIVAYRRGRKAMSAYDFEFAIAKEAGVRAIFNVTPVNILGDDFVTGVEFMRTTQIDGSVEQMEDSNFVIECDTVIRATGQEKMVEFLNNIEGLDLDSRGRILVNEFAQTGNHKYFAAGDAVNGGAEVVNAVAEGKRAAIGMDRYLNKGG